MFNFWNKKDFKNIVNKDIEFRKYFNQISKKEYLYRYNINYNQNVNNIDIYYNNILEFNNYEKYIITNILLTIKNRQKWNFFKLHKKIDRGMPFTLGNFIFLPSDFITKNTAKYIRDTLIHEQIHIHQFNNKLAYKQFYSRCGFEEVNKEIEDKLLSKYNILTNPDSLKLYIYKNTYIPLFIINKNNSNHITVLYNIQKNRLESINIFRQIFGIDNNLCGPNEIFAELFVIKYRKNINI